MQMEEEQKDEKEEEVAASIPCSGDGLAPPPVTPCYRSEASLRGVSEHSTGLMDRK